MCQFIVDISQTLPQQIDALITATSVYSAEDMLRHIGLIPAEHMSMIDVFKWMVKYSKDIAEHGVSLLSRKDTKNNEVNLQVGDIKDSQVTIYQPFLYHVHTPIRWRG